MIKAWLTALTVAFMFLTRLPMPTLTSVTSQDEGRSLIGFPVVGLALGTLLAFTAMALAQLLPAGVCAALVICLWVLISGALHLDGLADSADAWLSGASGERALEIMKDPRCGSAAVAIVGCLLLVKFSALLHLIENGLWWPLVIAPIVGRCIAPLILLTTPYANPTGIGQSYIEQAPGFSRLYLLFVIGLSIFSLALHSDISLVNTLITLALLTGIITALRRMMLHRLGGTNGDTAGATVEITEALLLISFCIY